MVFRPLRPNWGIPRPIIIQNIRFKQKKKIGEVLFWTDLYFHIDVILLKLFSEWVGYHLQCVQSDFRIGSIPCRGINYIPAVVLSAQGSPVYTLIMKIYTLVTSHAFCDCAQTGLVPSWYHIYSHQNPQHFTLQMCLMWSHARKYLPINYLEKYLSL